VTASVGVATFPDHAADADGLFRAADAGHVFGQRAPARTASRSPLRQAGKKIKRDDDESGSRMPHDHTM